MFSAMCFSGGGSRCLYPAADFPTNPIERGCAHGTFRNAFSAERRCCWVLPPRRAHGGAPAGRRPRPRPRLPHRPAGPRGPAAARRRPRRPRGPPHRRPRRPSSPQDCTATRCANARGRRPHTVTRRSAADNAVALLCDDFRRHGLKRRGRGGQRGFRPNLVQRDGNRSHRPGTNPCESKGGDNLE